MGWKFKLTSAGSTVHRTVPPPALPCGFEPLRPGSQNEKKQGTNPCFFHNGGPEGVRTLGLRVANAALSQLSHGPTDILPE